MATTSNSNTGVPPTTASNPGINTNPNAGGRANLPQFTTNSNGKIELPREDFFYIVDRLVAESNDNFILRHRVHCLELIVKWCLNFFTFVHSFSTLFFQNNLPISAVILNNDTFKIPFKLVEMCETCSINMRTHLATVYESCRLLNMDMATMLDSLTPVPTPVGSEAFLKYVRQMNANYDTFVVQYNDDSSNYTFLSPFDTLDAARLDTLTTKMREATTAIGLSFSPQYLVKQTLLSHTLMYFASAVFSYVPQLKTDFLRSDNLQFTLDQYAERLHSFWRDQVNVCIEPFFFAYKNTNLFNVGGRELSTLYENTFKRANSTHTMLSQDTQLLLKLHDQRTMSMRFNDPVNQSVADVWRRLFVGATEANARERMVRLAPLTDKDRDSLFTQFLADLTNGAQNLFDANILNRTHSMYMANRSDYLTNIKYTYFEQCCLLKLVIRYLLQRWYIGARPPFDGHDPLDILMNRVFWKPQELYPSPYTS